MSDIRPWLILAVTLAQASAPIALAQVTPRAPTNLLVEGGIQLPPPPPLPQGVTLRAIDGGQNYYANNGFTYAVNMGWDDPNFFPIGPWYSSYDNSVIPNTTT